MSNLTRKSLNDLKSVEWVPLGEGSNNITYVTTKEVTVQDTRGTKYTGLLVYKVPFSKEELSKEEKAMDAPDRACRLFSALNPGKFCALFGEGAVYEYFPGKLNDPETASALLEAYIKDRRIILDAYVTDNLLRSISGKPRFADNGLAVRQDSIRSKALLKQRPDLKTLHSLAGGGMIETTALIEALLYLETQIPFEAIRDEYITKKILGTVGEAARNQRNITVAELNELAGIDGSVNPTAPEPMAYEALLESILDRFTRQRQNGKHEKLNQHLIAYKEASGPVPVIDDGLRQILSIDRSPARKAARECASFLVNAILLLLCVTGVGIAIAAPLFCRQKSRTGSTPFFFTKPKGLEQLEIAHTAARLGG